VNEYLEGDGIPPPGELIVETAMNNAGVVVSLAGEIDLTSVQRLERQLAAAQAGDAHNVVVDLTGVQFIDSTGLRALLSAKRRANDAGRELLLRNPQAQVQRLFEIAGMVELLSLRRD
jgi:anti-sigma B factor antagonist